MQVSGNIEQGIESKSVVERLKSVFVWMQVPLFTLFVGLALFYGWRVRIEEYWTAEYGVGYALGIIGGVIMLSQFLYPMRKKWRWMRNLGKISIWFQAHMSLGLIGPLLILYHANFSLGSINSNVALGAMGLVVFSGLVGRYIYTKINHTLHGRIATLVELRDASEEARSDLKNDLVMDTAAIEDLRKHEYDTRHAADSWLGLAPKFLLLGIRTRVIRWRLKRRLSKELKKRALEEKWTRPELRAHIRIGKRHIRDYLKSIRKVSEFKIYRKIFALWHVLHIPLFIMLVVSAVVHIVAVHLY